MRGCGGLPGVTSCGTLIERRRGRETVCRLPLGHPGDHDARILVGRELITLAEARRRYEADLLPTEHPEQPVEIVWERIE